MEHYYKNLVIIGLIVVIIVVLLFVQSTNTSLNQKYNQDEYEITKPQENNVKYMDGIDVIYWINLDRSNDRRIHMNNIFRDPVFKDMNIERISAIDGRHKNIVYPKLNFICYEASDAMNTIARQNIANSCFDNRVTIVKDDFFNASGKFDLVIANRVLHHVNDTENFWKLVSNLSDNVLVCDLERPQQLSYIDPEFPEDLKNSFMAAYTVDEVAKQIKSYNYTVSREEHQGGLCTYTVFTKKDIKFRF